MSSFFMHNIGKGYHMPSNFNDKIIDLAIKIMSNAIENNTTLNDNEFKVILMAKSLNRKPKENQINQVISVGKKIIKEINKNIGD